MKITHSTITLRLGKALHPIRLCRNLSLLHYRIFAFSICNFHVNHVIRLSQIVFDLLSIHKIRIKFTEILPIFSWCKSCVKRDLKCRFPLKNQAFRRNVRMLPCHLLFPNPKILQIHLIPILCRQTSISQESSLILPFLQSPIIVQFKIVLNDERYNIVFQAFLEHD